MQSTWSSFRNCQQSRLKVYTAFDSYQNELLRELEWFAQKNSISTYFIKPITETIFLSDLSYNPVWAKSIWSELEFHDITSISSAAKILKSCGKFISPYSENFFRRSELIQQQVSKFRPKKLNFLENIKTNHHCNWLLLEEDLLLLSRQTTSQFHQDKVEFNETAFPPSRAYLKLWELFTVHQIKPQPKEKVVDFGSSPGGWTWVLQNMGCEVLSVDKAPLSPSIVKLPNVTILKKDAFTIKPEDLGPIDWFFSDIICYPEKMYDYLQTWLNSDLCLNFVITIKLQGPCPFDTIELYKMIPNAKVIHLHHNKHELTFIKIRNEQSQPEAK